MSVLLPPLCLPVPLFSSQYNSWISQTGLKKKEMIVLDDNAVYYAGRHNSLLCAMSREMALNGFKRLLIGLDSLRSEMYKVQMLLFFSRHKKSENTEAVRVSSFLSYLWVHSCV